MAISLFDFTKGIDFTGLLNDEATAADHNTLIDAAVPYATDKGLVMVSRDTALGVPDVPNPLASAAYNKWKNYVWMRLPHATDTNTVPFIYCWNDNAVSVLTYLKWQRATLDTSALEALIAALDLRVDDLEASMATALATANAANATAATASTNATAALTTANTANTNALTALSDLNTPTTGIKDRVTSLETRVTNLESQVTTINATLVSLTLTVNSGFGPVFFDAPIVILAAVAGAVIETSYNAFSLVPSNARTVILQVSATSDSFNLKSVYARKNTSVSNLTILETNSVQAGSVLVTCQCLIPLHTDKTFLYSVTGNAGSASIKIVGYVV